MCCWLCLVTNTCMYILEFSNILEFPGGTFSHICLDHLSQNCYHTKSYLVYQTATHFVLLVCQIFGTWPLAAIVSGVKASVVFPVAIILPTLEITQNNIGQNILELRLKLKQKLFGIIIFDNLNIFNIYITSTLLIAVTIALQKVHLKPRSIKMLMQTHLSYSITITKEIIIKVEYSIIFSAPLQPGMGSLQNSKSLHLCATIFSYSDLCLFCFVLFLR